MDGALFQVVVCAVVGLAVGLPLGLLVLLVRGGRQADLIRRLVQLEDEVAALRAPAAASQESRGITASPSELASASPRPASTPISSAAPTTSPRTPEILRRPIAPARVQSRPPIEWERWFGIKGAAVLGGALLALAGLLFVQYSIQQGWLGPTRRCSFGALVGFAAIATSWPLRSRGYATTSDALTGAGATILYGACWAALTLYGLIPAALAFLAMAAVTVVCGALAFRRRSQTIAVFGVLGGFATPLLVSLAWTPPLGLFAYLLLLDVAVLALGRARPWSPLAILASIATPIVFATWVATQYEEAELPGALAFCGLSALVFAARAAVRGRSSSRLATVIACVSPFFFAAYFAGSAQLDRHLVSIALLLAILELAALWSTAILRTPMVSLAAALGSAATVAVWIAGQPGDAALAWEGALVAVALATLLHAGLELARHRSWPAEELLRSAAVGVLGLGACMVLGALRWEAAPLWPWLTGASILAALLTRQVRLGARASLQVLGALGVLGVYISWRHFRSSELQPLTQWTDAAVVVGLAAAAALVRNLAHEPARKSAAQAAITVSGVLLCERATISPDPTLDSISLVLATAAVAALGVAASRTPRRAWGFAILAPLAWLAPARCALAAHSSSSASLGLIAVTALLGIGLACVPHLDARDLGRACAAWRTAAIVALIWCIPMGRLIGARWRHAPDSAGWMFGAFLSLTLAARLWNERMSEESPGVRGKKAIGFAWFAGCGVALAAFAFAVEVGHAVALIGAALAGAGLAAVSRTARHTGLRLAAIVACAFTLLRVLLQFTLAIAAPHEHVRSGLPILHWLSYEIGVPALALLGTAWLLAGGLNQLVTDRQNIRALALHPATPGHVALAGILAAFLWLNVEVVNLVSSGPTYALDLQRMPSRDVALSVVWSLFALGLLVLGVQRDRLMLRWTSLGFFLATIVKVFLYDLGALRGLYRVGSLCGLALALLLVSLLYQRYVFRPRIARGAAGEEETHRPAIPTCE